MSDEVMIRDEVLTGLANRTRTDPEFKRKARTNLEGTLNEYGYELTEED